MRSLPSRRRMTFGVTLTALTAALLLPIAAPAGAATIADPLQQTLSADEPTLTDRKVFDDGHIDIGPRWQDGEWSVQVHSGVSPDAEWRHPDNAVLRVVDASRTAVPDDPTYDFLHTDAGTEVAVVPQTQQPGVVWVGWNTQDPAAMEQMGDGVTMALHGVQGPGDLVVYLQSGTLGAPQVLWDSTAQMPQDLFVDTNSHTHANWVFTKPGVYLVDLEVRATLEDGSTVSDTQPIRFAVGNDTSTDDAFSARYTAESSPVASMATDPGGSGPSDAVVLGVGVGAGVLVLLLVVIVVVAVRGARARRRARSVPAGSSDGAGAEDERRDV